MCWTCTGGDRNSVQSPAYVHSVSNALCSCQSYKAKQTTSQQSYAALSAIGVAWLEWNMQVSCTLLRQSCCIVSAKIMAELFLLTGQWINHDWSHRVRQLTILGRIWDPQHPWRDDRRECHHWPSPALPVLQVSQGSAWPRSKMNVALRGRPRMHQA